MSSTKSVSKKIALIGSHAVGKTSLVSQFIHNKFPEEYLTTIGLKVDKKTVVIDNFQLDMVIWDIAGQDDADNVPHYYLRGCSGIILVTDLSRPNTYKKLKEQASMLKGLIPNVEIVIAANKKDLLTAEEITRVTGEYPLPPDAVTSAKLGEGVEEMFIEMAKKLLAQHDTQGA
ncbi:MAG: Rab family GTPase [Bacteroidota bacterium]